MSQPLRRCIKAVSAMLLMLAFLMPPLALFADPPNDPPRLDKIPEVRTDRRKPGARRDELPNVTMCPDKWGRLGVNFRYQADERIVPESADPAIAQVSYRPGGAALRDRTYVVIHTGPNEGETPITTTVTVRGQYVQLGGQSPTRPNHEEFATMQNTLGQFTVTVLPGKKPPCGQPRVETGGDTGVVPGGGGQEDGGNGAYLTNHNEESIELCVGQRIQKDLTTGFNTNPTDLRVTNYDDPTVASAQTFVHKQNGRQTKQL